MGSGARTIGFMLGLGDLDAPAPCHGYSHACPCFECEKRVRLQQERAELAQIVQPWDVRKAA